MTSADQLREHLKYDPETGVLTWLKRPGSRTVVYAGDVAGNINRRGYRVIRLHKREASTAQNAMNKGSVPNGTSKFKGVSWCRAKQKWKVSISIDGDRVHLGYFSSEEEAAKAYDDRARIHHGEFARLNLLVA